MTSRVAPATTEHTAQRLRYVLVRLARALRRSGSTTLSPSQVSALATIEEYGPLRISALATHEAMDPSVATRLVASLEGQGDVARTNDPDDRRACLVGMSAQGRLTLASLWNERTIGISSRLERLSEDERRRLDAALPVLEKLARDHAETTTPERRPA